MGEERPWGSGAKGKDDVGRIAEKLYQELAAKLIPQLQGEADEAKRYLLFLSWLNTRLEEMGFGRIVITGGFAVELYTGRAYRTMDVDVIVEGAAALRVVEQLLAAISERIGRGYLPAEPLNAKSIDIVSTVYPHRARPVKLVVGQFHVYIEPPEEIIVTYLSGWKHWGSTEDRDKAIWVYTVWKDRLDEHYLEQRAREEEAYEMYEELKRICKEAAK
ncbi:MAG: hypothetical protein ABWW70_00175 [Thermoproteota archaeon]